VTAGVLLLAAGASRRFGSDKRMARLRGGSTLLEASVAAARAAGLPVRVCLAAADRDGGLASSMAGQAEVVCCATAAEGMGATLSEAVAGLPAWDVLLLALADMPLIRADSYRAVHAAASSQRIVVPVHAGRDGHPVAFGSAYFPALMQCRGDRGARWLLQREAAGVLRLPVDDPGILRDVDTPEVLAAL
jgi:molybdenum cofactor cytidylyltransferase